MPDRSGWLSIPIARGKAIVPGREECRGQFTPVSFQAIKLHAERHYGETVHGE